MTLAVVFPGLAAARRQVTKAVAASPLLTNLASYWKLEEASGTRADEIGSQTLTDNNTVTQAVGKLGNAAQFTAANSESLSHADSATLSLGADQDFTLGAWVYLDSKGANRVIASKWAPGLATKDIEYLL